MRTFSGWVAMIALTAAAALARGTLVSGPMLGYQAHREVLIWVETREAESVTLEYWLAGQPAQAKRITRTRPTATPAGVQPLKFVLPLLEMGQAYEYALSVDGERLAFAYPLRFRTTTQWEWRTPPPAFRFVFGSCSYFNDAPYDRPGTPYGKGTEIFQHIARSGADFMLWGGDNLYLREADFSSESGIWYRYSKDRATPDLQRLFAAMHHYATWDDHDFGSNDANRSFEFKEATLAAFQSYWGNPGWGERDNPGVYGKFFWGDAAFILMDNRYHRDDTTTSTALQPAKSQYGARQLEWLKQSLLHAQVLRHFTFKFVVTGSQFITDVGGGTESFAHYRREREELLTFIAEQKITGVIFLTGDVHLTELARKKVRDTQWIYELTSSPLASGVSTRRDPMRDNDPNRLPGTLVIDQNYCVLGFSGAAGERKVTITCFDKTNAKRWEHAIAEAELR